MAAREEVCHAIKADRQHWSCAFQYSQREREKTEKETLGAEVVQVMTADDRITHHCPVEDL